MDSSIKSLTITGAAAEMPRRSSVGSRKKRNTVTHAAEDDMEDPEFLEHSKKYFSAFSKSFRLIELSNCMN